MGLIDERVWAEIDLNALEQNAKLIKKRLGGDVGHIAVIKADAYGHGSVRVAQTLERCGVSYLAVACISEALALRDAGIRLPILIQGYTPPDRFCHLSGRNLTQTVFDVQYAHKLSDQAENAGQTLKIHIKTDTGMNRLGVRTAGEVREILTLPGLRAEGLYTHLASADTPGNPSVAGQLAAFNALMHDLGNVKFDITHCANSGGVLYYKESWFNMARSGLLLFGASEMDGFSPVMKLCARVAQVKTVSGGERVSYGGTYQAPRDMKIAVVCAGYADGYLRSFSNRAVAVCQGVRVPVVGRVCMDMTMFDVTELDNVRTGDVVTLFGGDGLYASELAEYGGTISYEVLCAVSRRVPRVY